MDRRPTTDEYFMLLAFNAALRGTCPRAKCGAVLVRDKRVVLTGYNGAPPGFRQCDEGGCVMFRVPGEERERCINAIHAELNSLVNARVVGDTIYCTHQPCINCLKAILSHNPEIRIRYYHEYSDLARDTFIAAHRAVMAPGKMIDIERLDVRIELTSIVEDNLASMLLSVA